MKKTIIVLIALFFPAILFSQTIFRFDADFAFYKQNKTKSALEIYFSFYHNSLKYIYDGNSFIGNAYLHINIIDDENNKIILDEDFLVKIKTADTAFSKLKNKEISQVTLFLENSKNYTLNLIGSDNKLSSRSDTISYKFSLPNFFTDKVELSELQLSTSIEKSTNKESSFYKFGYEVVPNPNSLFGTNIKTLFYYFEIYNIKTTGKDDYKLKIVLENNNKNVLTTSYKNISSESDLFIEVGKFDTDTLPSGSYFLNIQVLNSNDSVISTKEKKFFIFNGNKTNYRTSEDKDYLQSVFVSMSEQDVQDEFSKIIYLRNSIEASEFEKLTNINDKRKFLFFFWKRRDANPVTVNCEFRDEYMKRYIKANANYKQGFTEGWKTDRGRIFMIYGEPNDVERHFMEADLKNYEIWSFDNVEGGTKCMFAESSSSGQGYYYLVNSTMKNELSDPNWQEKLKKMR